MCGRAWQARSSRRARYAGTSRSGNSSRARTRANSATSTDADGPVTGLKPLAGPQGADAVGLLLSVLEVPVGSRFANGDLWAMIDEQVVPLDHKAALEDNGFRIGVVGGIRPDGFDDLLTKPRF